MRLQVMSDLHLEMHADGGAAFVRELDPEGVDLLVLAGDIAVARDFEPFERALGAFAEKFPRVLYVAGNHEYYRSSPARVAEHMQRLGARHKNLLPAENQTLVIEGRRFVVGTMWFPPPHGAIAWKRALTDFAVIQDFEPWVYDQNAAFAKLAESIAPDDVVVTHHLPALASVSPHFEGSPLNAFFVSDMADVIATRQPRLWIHGHTHTRSDYHLGGTRVVCNPLGYPRELGAQRVFDPRLVIEV